MPLVNTDVIASILARLDRLAILVGQKTEEVLPTIGEPMVSPNSLSLNERIAEAMKGSTDFDALVGQVAYETGISTSEARKKVRETNKQLYQVSDFLKIISILLTLSLLQLSSTQQYHPYVSTL